MKDLLKIRQARAAKVAEMRTMLDAVETRSDKQFTGDEKAKYDSLETEVRNMTTEIDREESIQALERGTVVPATPASPSAKRSFGDFLMECRFNPNSSGLARRDLTMADGPAMGFAVPPEFDAMIRMVDPDSAIIRPRATVIPAGSAPDAAFTMNALDQSGSKGVYSGITMKWIAEVAAVQEVTNPTIRQVKLEPQQVSGFIDVSDKLLRNAAAVGALVEKLMRSAIIGTEEAAFLAGDGIGKPLGIIGCPGSIEVSRSGGASTVTYADICAMFAKLKFGGRPVWIASQTILPQLMTLRDAVGNAMWQPNARDGAPSTLMGLPLIINDQSPVLGSKGDLVLSDLGYYFIKDGSPLTILMNPYIQQTNGLTRIIAFWNVDAQPFVTTPLLQRDGVSTVSPFVVLK
jgi:HK97 family phage major capsid protein